MTDERAAVPAASQTVGDADKQRTAFDDLLRLAVDDIEEGKQALDTLLSSSARSSRRV
jgi:hypothetical protein